jgi:hypothetical protein
MIWIDITSVMKDLLHHHRHRRVLKHIATFYTYWALGFHMLYLLGLVPNTFVIAMIVVVISQVVFWIWPGHAYQHWHKMWWVISELLAHWLPFVLFILLEGTVVWTYEIAFAVITLLIYILVHGHKKIHYYYTHMSETVDHIRHH